MAQRWGGSCRAVVLLVAMVLLSGTLPRSLARFDYRKHLGTKTRYVFRRPIPGAPLLYSLPDPTGYEPVYLYLVSRHGTRWPTGDRMEQINSLVATFKDARHTDAYPWMRDWKPPFAGMDYAGGELHPVGEDELWGLAYRLRKRLPELLREPYFPKRYPVRSTEVPRAAASASAFTSAFFPFVEPVIGNNPEVEPLPGAASSATAVTTAAASAGRGLGRKVAPAASSSSAGAAAAALHDDDDDDTLAAPDQRRRALAMEADARRQRQQPSQDGAASRWVESAQQHPFLEDFVLEGGTAGNSSAGADGHAGDAADGAAASPLLQQLQSFYDVPQRDIRRPQAVAITMAPKRADPLLRFFDMCPAYAQHDEYVEGWLATWLRSQWATLVPALEQRLGMSRAMDPCEVEALWELCLMEAGLLNVTERACSLFGPDETKLLEWLDDVELYETQSYGAAINYNISAPLLSDILTSLQTAAASSGLYAPPPAQHGGLWPGMQGAESMPARARLMFAHCETLVPLATLMGLFQEEGQEGLELPSAEMAADAWRVPAEDAQRHIADLDALEDLRVRMSQDQDQDAGRNGNGRAAIGGDAPPACYKGKPMKRKGAAPPDGWRPSVPQDPHRVFRGGRVAPYGANLALILYREMKGPTPRHKVRLVYNEQVVPLPGCGEGGDGSSLDYDLNDFVALLEGRSKARLDELCAVPPPPAASPQ